MCEIRELDELENQSLLSVAPSRKIMYESLRIKLRLRLLNIGEFPMASVTECAFNGSPSDSQNS